MDSRRKTESKHDVKKSGKIISSDALNDFINKTPKYSVTKLGSSSDAISLVVGGLLAGLLAFVDSRKSKNISPKDVENYLKKKINLHEKRVNTKKAELKKLQEEIELEEQNLEKYKYALEKLDLKLIADEINKEA